MTDQSDHKTDDAMVELEAQVRRYSLRGMPDLRFVRRPVGIRPKDGTLCWADCGTADLADPYAAATYSGGEWFDIRGKPLKRAPTFWTEMANNE